MGLVLLNCWVATTETEYLNTTEYGHKFLLPLSHLIEVIQSSHFQKVSVYEAFLNMNLPSKFMLQHPYKFWRLSFNLEVVVEPDTTIT